MLGKNKQTGKEVVIVDKDRYIFKGNFSLIESIENNGMRILDIYNKLATEKATHDEVLTVLRYAIESKNGKEIKENEEEIKKLIDLKGYAECYALALVLTSYAVIGEACKKKSLAIQKTTQLLRSFQITQLKNLKKLGLSLVVQLLTSTILLWLILSCIKRFIF